MYQQTATYFERVAHRCQFEIKDKNLAGLWFSFFFFLVLYEKTKINYFFHSFACMSTALVRSWISKPERIKSLREELYNIDKSNSSPTSPMEVTQKNSQKLSPNNSAPASPNSTITNNNNNNHMSTNSSTTINLVQKSKSQFFKDIEDLIKCFDGWHRAEQLNRFSFDVSSIVDYVRNNLEDGKESIS